MSDLRQSPHAWSGRDALILAARVVLAVVFLYLGLNKALHPIEFLKLVRQYGIFESPLLLNLAAAALPWIEVVCGMLLLTGVAVRGTSVLLLALLLAFTSMIVVRALGIQDATGLVFCAIKFDCGCGSGEVLVCRKIAENAGLMLLCVIHIVSERRRFCWRHTLLRSR